MSPWHFPVDFADPARAEKNGQEATGEETAGGEK